MSELNIKIIAKLQKLLAMANDKRGNEQECSNAAEMAQKLMTVAKQQIR